MMPVYCIYSFMEYKNLFIKATKVQFFINKYDRSIKSVYSFKIKCGDAKSSKINI